ncbi:MAG: AlpA family phage regulatory protein [Chloroflexi bacterium]|nr:AlpA family phage regulatory protein [Chloroflexota bacterium]
MPGKDDRLLRLKDVVERTALSRATIYDMMAAGRFPQPVRVGPKSNRWWLSELDSFLEECPRGIGTFTAAT